VEPDPDRHSGPRCYGPDLSGQGRHCRPVTALTHADGVTGSSGPYPLASPLLRVRLIKDPVIAEGRDETMPAIDRPYVTDGTWVRPGGAVIERGFAEELNVRPGDRITLDTEPFTVVGEAVDAGRGANWRPQLIWLTRADARHLQAVEGKQAYLVDLRLSDANAAPAFATAHYTPNLFIATWQDIQGSDEKAVTVVQIVLLVGTWLLGMLAISSVAVLGRRPDGGADPAGRPAQGGRRGPVAGRGGAAGREPGARAGRHRDWVDRRAAGRAGAVQPQRPAARRGERALGDAGHSGARSAAA